MRARWLGYSLEGELVKNTSCVYIRISYILQYLPYSQRIRSKEDFSHQQGLHSTPGYFG